MIGRVGSWMTRVVRRVMPDPFVLALLLTLLVLAADECWNKLVPRVFPGHD